MKMVPAPNTALGSVSLIPECPATPTLTFARGRLTPLLGDPEEVPEPKDAEAVT